MGRFSALAIAALIGVCAFAAGASASTWTTAQLPSGGVNAPLYAVSCPSPSLCVATGGNNTIAATTNPTGDASAWNVAHPGGTFELPPELPIASAERAQAQAVSFGGAQIRGVSCPSAGLCVAVSFQGNFYSSTNPTGGASAWKAVPQAESGPNIHMLGISCPTVSFCVAVAYGGKVLTSTNPTGDSSAWAVTQLAEPLDLRGISCPSVSLCVAVDNEGRIASSTDPDGGPGAWQSAGAPAGSTSLNGISCPSTSFCVTGNTGQMLTSTNPAAGAWKAVTAGTGLSVTGVSCPLVTACAAVDDNADVIVSQDPSGGQSAWSFENTIPYGTEEGNGTFGISCPATTLCVAVGQHLQVIASIDPFSKALPEPPAAAIKSGRPLTQITSHPAKRINPRKHGVRVSFRFRAIGKATGFQCKLDKHRFRPCKSPQRYRAGNGKHVFKVRAVGPTGLLGPAAHFHFRVGFVVEPPPVGSCPQRPRAAFPGSCVNAR